MSEELAADRVGVATGGGEREATTGVQDKVLVRVNAGVNIFFKRRRRRRSCR